MATAGATQYRRVATGKTFAVGLVTGLIGLLANAVAAFFTTWTATLAWLAVPVAGVGVSIIGAFATAHVETRFQPGPPGGGPPGRPPRSRGMSLPVVIILVVLVLGLGGLAASFGVKYAVGWLSGNEEGVDRLAKVARAEQRGLKLSVEGFAETRHFTQLTVTATNGVGHSLTLPLFNNSSVRGKDGTTIEADPFRSDWADSVPPGAKQRGTITFPGHLPDGVNVASLSFSTVFGQGFDGPDSITVDSVRLRPRAPG